VIAFEAIPAGVGVLRRAVRTHIIAWGVPAVVEQAQLVVTELATNVIKHVGEGTAATLVLEIRAGRCRIELHDTSQVMPASLQPDCARECGRGLHLLAAIADDWGTVLTASGKKVWCELSVWSDEHRLRLRRAADALAVYDRDSCGQAGALTRSERVLEEVATRLIADSLHWLAARGSDPDSVLDRAQTYFETEAGAV
jgi:hypothetical protein